MLLLSRILFLTLLFFQLSEVSSAQFAISGRLNDARTGESLPAANIHIEGTYRGTISNHLGEFELVLREIPSRVVIRYIGYETVTLTVADTTKRFFAVRMKPVDLELPEIVVTGDDPGKDIMRQVIARKKIWRDKLMTFQAEAYTRQSLQTDTMIASITESYSTAFWDRKKGPREIIKAKRQTKNMKSGENWAASSYIPNFYDDDITIANFKMVGPTHPDALSFYTFKLADYQYIDNELIFILDMKPRRPLQPTFIGTLKVLARDYALLEVDVKPGESVTFPPPIQEFNVAYRQQFNNYGAEFWLPVDVRMNGLIKVGLPGLQFPPIKYNQISTMSDYEVNILLPDSLYGKKDVLVFDSVSIAKNTLFLETKEPVPMSLEEQRAYSDLDSTNTFEKMFKPKGVLARFIEDDDDDEDGSRRRKNRRQKKGKDGKPLPPSAFEKFINDFSPDGRYNRVEGGHIGVFYEPTMPKKVVFRPEFSVGYNSNLERYDWSATGRYRLKKKKKTYRFEGGYREGAVTRYESLNYDLYSNTIASFFLFTDYFDYYWNRTAWFSAEGRIRKPGISWKAGFSNELHSSLTDVSGWNPIGLADTLWQNPAIREGWMRPVTAKLTWGDSFAPMGVVGSKGAELKVEHASGVTGSDFSFTKLNVRADYRIETFYRRRFMPNTLDIRFQAGTYAGTLPSQRLHSLDGSLALLSPFGTFRSSCRNPIVAKNTAAVFWEHNFRTIPTEILGLKRLAKKGTGLILFGNHGYANGLDGRYLKRNQLLPDEVWIHEIGIGVNGIFSIFRADITAQINQPGVFFTVTAARLF